MNVVMRTATWYLCVYYNNIETPRERSSQQAYLLHWRNLYLLEVNDWSWGYQEGPQTKQTLQNKTSIEREADTL